MRRVTGWLHQGTRIFFSLESVLCMWFYVVCFLEDWGSVDVVSWVYVTPLLCEEVVQLSCRMEDVVVCVSVCVVG